jgi:hypothetical protein
MHTTLLGAGALLKWLGWQGLNAALLSWLALAALAILRLTSYGAGPRTWWRRQTGAPEHIPAALGP